MSADRVPEKPGPTPNPETVPFWAGLSEGRVRLQSCRRCGRLQHYARSICTACWSEDLTWVDAAGTGVVHTWTVVHRPGHPAWTAEAPYGVLVVELDEGPHLVTSWEGDLDRLRIGLRVRLTTRAQGESHVLVAHEDRE